jgi:hypothetical protein
MKTRRSRLVAALILIGTLAGTRHAVAHQTLATADDPAPADKTLDTRAARREVSTVRRTLALSLDGRLDDEAWVQAPVITDFTQSEPVEGAAPTERTEVRVVYDNDALYVGARLYDSAPDSIIAQLGRRDAELSSDLFGVFLDPYHDRRTGYYFGVNAGGTLLDGVLMNDDWDDETWDGVWEGKARIDAQGWTVEMRIPYSQMRFKPNEFVWGINFRRDIARKNEEIFLVYTPRGQSGFVSRFFDLNGIQGIQPRRQMEVMPYLTTRAEFTDQPDGNPFNDGSRYVPAVGADFKLGITSNLTLVGTVNPDFGQVEVDPAVVNLSDVETFFEEKRPFFVEGANVFNFGFGGSNNFWGFNFGNPDFFYSRRLGGAPRGSTPGADYTNYPEGTRILGAAKLTGRLGSGWNVGTVQALTDRAYADLSLADVRSEVEVEPLSYYGIVRGQREVNEGYRALGFISTIAARDFKDPRLADQINSDAYVVGVDGWTFLDKNRNYVVTGWLAGSHIRGTEARITALQRNSLHYFQRPDLDAVEVDSSATALTGLGGRVMLNKQQGRWRINTAVGFWSPGFDLNDVGFTWNSNIINGHFVVSRRWTEPKSFYRFINLNTAVFQSRDFDGNNIWSGLFASGFIQFKNYYGLFFNSAFNPQTVNNRRTRGGPLSLNPPGFQIGGEINSDSRKPWVFGYSTFSYLQEQSWEYTTGPEVEWKPAPNLSLALEPELSREHTFAQWVNAYNDPLAVATFGRRYVFATLDQTTFSSEVRLNWTFTPTLSLQLFAQPLISSGEYQDYKELARARSYDFLTYGEDGSTFDPETLTADPDGDGPAAALGLPNPNFNFKSLRGTAVLRWEFKPGSVFYLVWTQDRSDFEDIGEFRLRPSVSRLFEAKPNNFFALKLNYWLSR